MYAIAFKSLFKQARNTYVAKLSHSKTHYYSESINAANGNQKKLYSIISSLTVVKNSNPLPPHDDIFQLAQDFGNFFVTKIENIRKDIESQTVPHPPSLPQTAARKQMSNFVPLTEEQVRKMIFKCKSTSCDLDPIPTDLLKQCIDIVLPVLTKMINLSLCTGIFPDEWKLALVIPLIKKLGLELIYKNYRPVSNLPFVSKLAERAVIDQENTHMSSNCPLPINSSAYQEYHSTESALLKVQSDIMQNMEECKVTLLVLIDLSAAFDTVDHEILLNLLESKFGITGTALEWHRSYLSMRKQCINLSGTLSDTFDLNCGVPQGSCLGPVLFTQYASTLFNVIYNHLNDAHAYADDHQLYLAFSPNSIVSQLSAVEKMQNCLSDVKAWMVNNKLKMNDAKTEFIIIGSRAQLKKIQFDSISVCGTMVKAVDDVRNLGAFFDSEMSMEKHISQKCASAFRSLYNFRKIRQYLNKTATETLIHSFIFSHLDYCNGLLYDLPEKQIKQMQRVQNMAARLVFRKPKFCHITPLLIVLHWLPVEYRIEYKILLFTFKGIHNMAPKYICDMFKINSRQYCNRKRTIIHDITFVNGNVQGEIKHTNVLSLNVPKFKTFSRRSLRVAGPRLWNKLPASLRLVDDIDVFKGQLKTHLFKKAHGL